MVGRISVSPRVFDSESLEPVRVTIFFLADMTELSACGEKVQDHLHVQSNHMEEAGGPDGVGKDGGGVA